MATQNEESKWHLDKKISVTHMFTTVAAITSLVIFGSSVNTRLYLVESAVTAAVKQAYDDNNRQDRAIADMSRQTRDDMRTINDKLDRLIERRNP